MTGNSVDKKNKDDKSNTVDQDSSKSDETSVGISLHAEYIDAFMLHDIFVMADKDRDGCLNFNELSYSFKILGIDTSTEAIQVHFADRNLMMKEKQFITICLDTIENNKMHSNDLIQTFKVVTDAAKEKGKNTKFMDTEKLISLLCEGQVDGIGNLSYEEGIAFCNLLGEDGEGNTDIYRLTNLLLNKENIQSVEENGEGKAKESTRKARGEEDENSEKQDKRELGEDGKTQGKAEGGQEKKVKVKGKKHSNAFVLNVLDLIEEDVEGNITNEDEIASYLDTSTRGSVRKSLACRLEEEEKMEGKVDKEKSKNDVKEQEAGADKKNWKDNDDNGSSQMKSFFMDSLLLHVTGLEKKKDTTKSIYFRNMLLSPKRMSTVFSKVDL